MKTATRLALTLSALLSLGTSAAAFAVDRVGDLPTKTVSLRDLDLSTVQGAEALYGRIASAARVVCRGAEIASIHACRARAIEDAVGAVGNPLLSSLHRSTVQRIEGLVQR